VIWPPGIVTRDRGTIIEDAVDIIAASGDIDRLARIKGKSDT
jgi:hypothetical protein